MAPTHATKAQRRYRYYVSRGLTERKTPVDGWRVPAAELENAVQSTLADWIGIHAASLLAAHDPLALIASAKRQLIGQGVLELRRLGSSRRC